MADAITVRNLVVCRGRRTILHDFSIGLPKGKVTAIIGPNGCGKSTFLKAVNGWPLKDRALMAVRILFARNGV